MGQIPEGKKCYDIPGSYALLHSEIWLTSGRGDAGVFMTDGARIFMNDGLYEFTDPSTVAALKTGAKTFVNAWARNLCDNTDTCPEYVDEKPATVGANPVVRYHYRSAGLSFDNRTGHIDDYMLVLPWADGYYQLYIEIPSTTSATKANELLKSFDEIAASAIVRQ